MRKLLSLSYIAGLSALGGSPNLTETSFDTPGSCMVTP
jgi:hypothetical protein